jgi:hypothetical protein
MAEVVRVVVPGETESDETWQLAAMYALKIASESTPAVSDLILLTHTKQQLEHTSLANHLGPTATKALSKGTKVNLPNGMTMRHETLRTLGHSARNTIVIAFYAEDRMLETLDGQNGIVGVVAVPDFDGQIDLWIQRWNPIIHGAKRSKSEDLVEDPVTEKALESITLRSNIAYNTLHPRDKNYANEVFRILRAKGHTLDANMIKSWAIRAGWKPGGAKELSGVADKVAKLKNKPSLSGIHDPSGRYDRWKG